MFYFFFESRNSKDDPVVIWLTGGPGCGSELALFYENGPFHITNNLSLTWNHYGWDQVTLFNFHVSFMESVINLHQTFFLICINKLFFLILQASNIIFVDQPTGTGFSYSSDDSDIRHDETGVSIDLYDFLQVRIKYIKVPCFIMYPNTR